jgi:hypothetical protein
MRIYFDENFSPHIIQALAVLQEGRKSEEVQVLSIAKELPLGKSSPSWPG